MTHYFLSKEYCKDQDKILDIKDTFTRKPFYTDYYYGILLKKNEKQDIVPLLLQNDVLIEQYNIMAVAPLVSKIHYEKCTNTTSDMNILIRIVEFINGMWCLYIERRHFWDCFESKGVTIVIAKDRESIDTFKEKYLKELYPRKVRINKKSTVSFYQYFS